MIYPQNFEQKIGFDKIRELLRARCLSPLGQERVDAMAFSDVMTTIERRLDETEEFIRIIREEDDFPDQYFFDVRPSLRRIKVEGLYLDEQELFDLRRSLDTIGGIVRFLRPSDNDDGETPYPSLAELAGSVLTFPRIIADIDRILDKYGRMKDNASPELLRIRRELTATASGISRSLNAILRAAQSEGYVDKDVSPTMRDGRLVIPVAPAMKRKLRGIVHDESSTGRTVFIEPAEVVEANNRVRELEGEERREIVRILTEFSASVRPSIPDMLQSYEFLAEMDFIRAKARLERGEESKALPDLQLLAADTRTQEGAEAKYLLALLHYGEKDYAGAEKEILDYIERSTPHAYWLARSFVLLSDVYVAMGKDLDARQYLLSLKQNYTVDDDIQPMIEERLARLKSATGE